MKTMRNECPTCGNFCDAKFCSAYCYYNRHLRGVNQMPKSKKDLSSGEVIKYLNTIIGKCERFYGMNSAEVEEIKLIKTKIRELAGGTNEKKG
jgi:hypothetical protein